MNSTGNNFDFSDFSIRHSLKIAVIGSIPIMIGEIISWKIGAAISGFVTLLIIYYIYYIKYYAGWKHDIFGLVTFILMGSLATIGFIAICAINIGIFCDMGSLQGAFYIVNYFLPLILFLIVWIFELVPLKKK